jgi:5'-deoxynucleotidase YfbR-like HD superfamily hydrolase
MHDGEEYVFGDIQRDLKKTKTYDGPRKAAEKLSKLIAKKYGLIYPYPKQLKRIDRIIGDRENEIDRYDSTRLDSYELTKARFLKEFYALTETHHDLPTP